MKKIESFYWLKKVKIPFKYRSVKKQIITILDKVESDRMKNISVTDITDFYNIYVVERDLVFECLEKYFELEVIDEQQQMNRLYCSNYIQTYYLVDIKSRKSDWFSYISKYQCDMFRFQNVPPYNNLFASYFNADFNIELYKRGFLEFNYILNFPSFIIETGLKQIYEHLEKNGIDPKLIETNFIITNNLHYNISLKYIKIFLPFILIQPLQEEEQITCENNKEIICNNIFKLIKNFEKCNEEDIENFKNKNSKFNYKKTVIDCAMNNINLNEKEFDLIKKLMLRRGYEINLKYNKTDVDDNKHLFIYIKELNNKERRYEEVKTMADTAEKYGFKLEKFDLSDIDLKDSNFIKFSADNKFKTCLDVLKEKCDSLCSLEESSNNE